MIFKLTHAHFCLKSHGGWAFNTNYIILIIIHAPIRENPCIRGKAQNMSERVTNPKFACSLCEINFKTNRNLRMHIRNIHEGKRKKEIKEACKICGLLAPKSFLKFHVERVHEKVRRYFCEKCKFSGYSVCDLKSHELQVHDENRNHVCEKCDYSCSSKKYLREHMIRNHESRKKKKVDTSGEMEEEEAYVYIYIYICPQCDYKGYTKACLKSHIDAIHLKKFIRICEYCDLPLCNARKLRFHIASKHKNRTN